MGLRWNKKASKEECRHPDKKVIAKFEHFFLSDPDKRANARHLS
jgi:hypothetical protein